MSENTQIAKFSNELFTEIVQLIEQAKQKVALVLNTETTLLYWNIGCYINENLKVNNRLEYGAKILATLSQELTTHYGKGYSYSALTRMCKVANCIDATNIATVSQQLSWSHLIELATISDELKREYYMLVSAQNQWGVRELREQMDKMLFERTALAKMPEQDIKNQLQQLKATTTHPDLMFKNTYVLDFLNLPQFYTESDLENALISGIEKFIMAIYGAGGEGGGGEKPEPPVKPKEELIKQLEEALEATESFLQEDVNFDLQELINAEGLNKLAAMEKAVNAVYTNDETKRKFQIMAREIFNKYKA